MRRNMYGDIELSMVDMLNIAAFGLSPEAIVAVAMANDAKAKVNHNTKRECRCNSKGCARPAKAESNTPKITDFVTRIISKDRTTVIFWADGTTTSVRCTPDEPYDYEKGISMAFMKYLFGNKYYEDMQKLMVDFPHLTTEEKKEVKVIEENNDNESDKKRSESKKKSANKKSKTSNKKTE